MPLLGSKRRKTDAGSPSATTNKTSEQPPRPQTQGNTAVRDGSRKPSLQAKASSPQLRPVSPVDGAPRPGLKRGNSRSWYGSFNSKATAVAQVAKESALSVAGAVTTESSGSNSQRLSQPSDNMKIRSQKASPSTSRTDDVTAAENHESARKVEVDKNKSTTAEKTDKTATAQRTDEASTANVPQVNGPTAENAAEEEQPTKQTPGGTTWFGWWSRPDGYAPSEGGISKDGAESTTEDAAATKQSPEPTTIHAGHAPDTAGQQPMKQISSGIGELGDRVADNASRAWFGLWSASQNQKGQEQQTPTIKVQDGGEVSVQKSDEAKVKPASIRSVETKQGETISSPNIDSARTSIDRPKSSGWAFWSKDKSSDQPEGDDNRQKHLGELAVANTPSQSHPEAAQFNEGSAAKAKPKLGDKVPQTKASKRDLQVPTVVQPTPPSKENKQVKKTVQSDEGFATNAKNVSSASLPLPDTSTADELKLSPATKALRAQHVRPNIIEPKFRSTYPAAYVPTYWESLGYYFTYPLGFAPPGPPSGPHVSLAPPKTKIKSAIAIGVHGYFPAPILQKIIGQPTGTSIKFATHAAAAIRSWVDKNQPDMPCDIEQVALEGEGFIADRVSTLWKLLLNWLTHLRNADMILVAAHSQGVPVAIMLVAKLIQLGCLSPTAKVGICAMAGVNLGPFADYKSRFFGGSAAELFDFSNPQSRVSLEYASSIEIVLRHGVKVTYVGSMDDQLVSLESSLFSNLTHPHVQRAVFIDGRLHAPDFIAGLIAFALKLRNLGISDHGLVRELSAPVAGSIYGGEGHSRIYDDDAVYQQALEFTLETTDMDPKVYLKAIGSQGTPAEPERRRSSERRRSQGGLPANTNLANSIRRGSVSASSQPGIAPSISRYEVPLSGANANPYYLPWAMRGILEEPTVKKDMQAEVQELIRLFDEWKPTSKALKDVKFRLEAVKSKL